MTRGKSRFEAGGGMESDNRAASVGSGTLTDVLALVGVVGVVVPVPFWKNLF